jgi:hypothetical protein
MNAAVHTNARVHRCRDDVPGTSAICLTTPIGDSFAGSSISVPLGNHPGTTHSRIGWMETVRRRRGDNMKMHPCPSMDHDEPVGSSLVVHGRRGHRNAERTSARHSNGNARSHLRVHHRRTGEPKGFTWADYRDLIIAAHRQLPGTPPLVWCWDNLNVHLAPAPADFAAENKEWPRIYPLPAYAPHHVHQEFNLVTAPNRNFCVPAFANVYHISRHSYSALYG